METTERTLKFGWTYASLYDYRNCRAEQCHVLDQSGCPTRPATEDEQRFIEECKGHKGGRWKVREVEWADFYTDTEIRNGKADRELQERIDGGLPLTEITLRDLREGETKDSDKR